MDEREQPQSLRDYLRLYMIGVGMGSADTVPGVSGGTVAFVMGIYSDLLNAVKAFNLQVLRHLFRLEFKAAWALIPWRFLLPLSLGIFTAIFSLARLVSWLMDNQRIYLFSFFFGLVVASALAVGTQLKRWTAWTIGAVIVGIVAAYAVVGLVPVEMPHDVVTLFLSGFVAIMAMILPGISGSSILLVLGQYQYVLNAVKTFDFVTLIALASGCAVGIALFSRFLSWVLRRYEQTAISILIGFVIGSLRAVWPWQVETTILVEGTAQIYRVNTLPEFNQPEFWIALGIAFLGFMLVSIIDHLASRHNPVFRLFRRPKPGTVISS